MSDTSSLLQALLGSLDSLRQDTDRKNAADTDQRKSVYQQLLHSDDPELKALGLSGLIEDPEKNWVGRIKKSKTFPQALEAINKIYGGEGSIGRSQALQISEAERDRGAGGAEQPGPPPDLTSDLAPGALEGALTGLAKPVDQLEMPSAPAPGPPMSAAQPDVPAMNQASPEGIAPQAATGGPASAPPNPEVDRSPARAIMGQMQSPAEIAQWLRGNSRRQATMLDPGLMSPTSKEIIARGYKKAEEIENMGAMGMSMQQIIDSTIQKPFALEQVKQGGRVELQGMKQTGREGIVKTQEEGKDRRTGVTEAGKDRRTSQVESGKDRRVAATSGKAGGESKGDRARREQGKKEATNWQQAQYQKMEADFKKERTGIEEKLSKIPAKPRNKVEAEMKTQLQNRLARLDEEMAAAKERIEKAFKQKMNATGNYSSSDSGSSSSGLGPPPSLGGGRITNIRVSGGS